MTRAQIAEAVREYMRTRMGMPDVEQDQEANWTYGHMVDFAEQILKPPVFEQVPWRGKPLVFDEHGPCRVTFHTRTKTNE